MDFLKILILKDSAKQSTHGFMVQQKHFCILLTDQILNKYLKDYVGRPSSLYYAENLTKKLGGAKIYLKREDLNHTGAHKINNVLGQALLAKKMGKKKLIAETGAGQHGVATATVCSLFNIKCTIFMGKEDIINGVNTYNLKITQEGKQQDICIVKNNP